MTATESEAYLIFEELRWGGCPALCPHCGVTDQCVFLTPVDGTTRRTRTGRSTARRVWRCKACRRQFSVLTGTVFEGTRIPLQKWIALVEAILSSENPSATKLGREHGLTPEAARHGLLRLAEAGVRGKRCG